MKRIGVLKKRGARDYPILRYKAASDMLTCLGEYCEFQTRLGENLAGGRTLDATCSKRLAPVLEREHRALVEAAFGGVEV